MVRPKLQHTNEYFIQRISKSFPNYDYSKVNYNGVNGLVEIGCPDHGFFIKKARNLISGFGCNDCAAYNPKSSLRSTTEIFTRKAIKVHGLTYGYKKVNYQGSTVKVEIVCSKHGSFFQSPDRHLVGSGCPTCNSFAGYSRTQWKNHCSDRNSYLYLVLINTPHESCYKVGITVNPKTRYYEMQRKGVGITEIDLIEFTKPEDSFDSEKLLHRILKPHKYMPAYKFDGRTECFLNNPFVLYEFQKFKSLKG